MGLFGINLALDANTNVEIVSSALYALGEIFAMITVFELPPSESFSTVVNIESLYLTGIFLVFFEFSIIVLITWLNVERD